MVTILDGLVTHLGRRGAVEFHLMIGAKSFQNGIEALTRPWKQLTKPVDGDPSVAGAEVLIERLELITLGLRL
jgi:hypothetical protein